MHIRLVAGGRQKRPALVRTKSGVEVVDQPAQLPISCGYVATTARSRLASNKETVVDGGQTIAGRKFLQVLPGAGMQVRVGSTLLYGTLGVGPVKPTDVVPWPCPSHDLVPFMWSEPRRSRSECCSRALTTCGLLWSFISMTTVSGGNLLQRLTAKRRRVSGRSGGGRDWVGAAVTLELFAAPGVPLWRCSMTPT